MAPSFTIIIIFYYVRTNYEIRSNDLDGLNIFHYCTRLNFFDVHWKTQYFLTWQHIRHFYEFGHSFYSPILYVIALVNGQFV